MSATRVIDFGKKGAGLGHNLKPASLADAILEAGKIDRTQVRSALASLSISATDDDVESIAEDLQTMRVTKHRKTAALDKVLSGMEQLKINLPAAVLELRESGTQSSLNAAFNLAAFDRALLKLTRAVYGAQRAAVWGATKQTWHDDAMWLAFRLKKIAMKSGGEKKLGFMASDGLTTRCISDLLALAGINERADTVAKAIKAHPQASHIF